MAITNSSDDEHGKRVMETVNFLEVAVTKMKKQKTGKTKVSGIDLLTILEQDFVDHLEKCNKEMVGSFAEKLSKIIVYALEMIPPVPIRETLCQALGVICSKGYKRVHEYLVLFTDLMSAKSSTDEVKEIMLDSCARLIRLRSYECASCLSELMPVWNKMYKSSEACIRIHVLLVLTAIIVSMGASCGHLHIRFHAIIKKGISDKSSEVRIESVNLLSEMCKLQYNAAAFEIRMGFAQRFMEDGLVEIRTKAAEAFGLLLGTCTVLGSSNKSSASNVNANVALNKISGPVLSNARRGSIVGKGITLGEALKFASVSCWSISKKSDFRILICHLYISFFQCFSSNNIEKNLEQIVLGVLGTFSRPNIKHFPSEFVAIDCSIFVSHAINVSFYHTLSEEGQLMEFRVLERLLHHNETTIPMLLVILRLLGIGVLSYGDGKRAVSKEMMNGILDLLMKSSDRNVHLQIASSLRLIGGSRPCEITWMVIECLKNVDKIRGQLGNEKAGKARNKLVISLTGYSFAAAALIRTGSNSVLGIPSAIYKQALENGGDLLQMKNHLRDEDVHIATFEAGWSLITSIIHPESQDIVDRHIKIIISLLRNAFDNTVNLKHSKAFPKSEAACKILCCELSLALDAAYNLNQCLFSESCEKMMIDLLVPMLENVVSFMKQLKLGSRWQPATLSKIYIVELNLYKTFVSLPPSLYQHLFVDIINMTITHICDGPSTKLLQPMLDESDSLLGPWSENEEEEDINNLQYDTQVVNTTAATEHPTSFIFQDLWDLPLVVLANSVPVPLPVQIVDAALQLFCIVFGSLNNNDVRKKCVQHLGEQDLYHCPSYGTNHIAALLGAINRLEEDGVDNVASTIGFEVVLLKFLENCKPELRRGAAEALGILARISDGIFTANLMKTLSNHLLEGLRNLNSAELSSIVHENIVVGCSLSLGCLQRALGAMRAGSNLPQTTQLLHTSLFHSSPSVHVWALHSLALSVDAAGPMFQQHFRATVDKVFHLLGSRDHNSVESYRAIGALVNAIVGAIGPELAPSADSESEMFRQCMTLHTVLQNHPHSLVQRESVGFFQRLILFAPQVVRFHSKKYKSLDVLRSYFFSQCLPLRLAAITCVRQLIQSPESPSLNIDIAKDAFIMFDKERNERAKKEAQLLLTVFVDSLDFTQATSFVDICKDLLAFKKILLHTDTVSSGIGEKSSGASFSGEKDSHKDDAGLGHDEDDDDDDDESMSQAMVVESDSAATSPDDDRIRPKWQTKVFILSCVSRLLSVVYESNASSAKAHFDLFLAKKLIRSSSSTFSSSSSDSQKKNTDWTESELNLMSGQSTELMQNYLVGKVGDLLFMGFQAATSDLTFLRTAGVSLMGDIVKYFSKSEDPEFPGHSVLEQYQAQFTSALRPAFSHENSPLTTAAACPVLVSFLISDVCTDPLVLKKIMQLLIERIPLLRENIYKEYSERAAFLVQIALLGSLAQLYVGFNLSESPLSEDMFLLLEPQLAVLREYWMLFLRDFAILVTQPAEAQNVCLGTFIDFSTVTDVLVEDCEKSAIPLMRAACSLTSTKYWLSDSGRPEMAFQDFQVLLGLVLHRLMNCHVISESKDYLLCLESLFSCSSYLKPQKIPLVNLQEIVFVLRKQMESTCNDGLMISVIKTLSKLILSMDTSYFDVDTKNVKKITTPRLEIPVESEEIDNNTNANNVSTFVFDVVETILWPLKYISVLAMKTSKVSSHIMESCVLVLNVIPLFQKRLSSSIMIKFLPSLYSACIQLLFHHLTILNFNHNDSDSLKELQPEVCKCLSLLVKESVENENNANTKDFVEKLKNFHETILMSLLNRLSKDSKDNISEESSRWIISCMMSILMVPCKVSLQVHLKICELLKSLLIFPQCNVRIFTLKLLDVFFRTNSSKSEILNFYFESLFPSIMKIITIWVQNIQKVTNISSMKLLELKDLKVEEEETVLAINIFNNSLIFVLSSAKITTLLPFFFSILSDILYLLKTENNNDYKKVFDSTLNNLLAKVVDYPQNFKDFLNSIPDSKKIVMEEIIRDSVSASKTASSNQKSSHVTQAPKKLTLDFSKYK